MQASKVEVCTPDTKAMSLQPGDLMTSEAGQWYATSSDKPCLAVLMTVGGPLLAGKKLCKISLAKVAQLAKNGGGDWRLDHDGNKIDWDADGLPD